jgi:peptidoglycan/LPS O-acetylase OafA/YrhL
MIEKGVPFGERYSTVLAGSLFFSAGAMIYHHRKYLKITVPTPVWWLMLLVFSTFPLVVRGLGGSPYYLGYYGPAVFFVPIFLSALSTKETKISSWFGELAYPMFLLHFFALGFVRWIFPSSLSPLSTYEFIGVYAATFAMSCATVRWFNPAIDRLRDALRPKHEDKAALPLQSASALT